MIHIYEPHGDDALISCWPLFSHQRFQNHQLRVVTLGSSRTSQGLMNYFPRVVSAPYADLYEIPMNIGKVVNYTRFRRWLTSSDGRTPWQWQRDVTMQENGELWSESSRLLWDFLYQDLKSNCRQGDWIFSPIGMLHPYHILVGEWLHRIHLQRPDVNWGLYSEAPYNSANWSRMIEKSHPMISRGLDQVVFPASNSEDKESIFRKVYPTEVRIFRYNHADVIPNETRLYFNQGSL